MSNKRPNPFSSRPKPNRTKYTECRSREGFLLKIVKQVSEENFDGNIKNMSKHFNVDYRTLLNLIRR